MSRLPKVRKIVSGGQTGVDRAGLNVAIHLELEHGGWCPQGRRAEDGEIPAIYQLQETESKDYSIRTEQNVIHSDGTLVLYLDRLHGGTALTVRLAKRHRRPLLAVDLNDSEIAEVQQWLVHENIGVLNVAGPRASSYPRIGKIAEAFLLHVFSRS